jgi:hypothetical protein
MTVAAIAPIVSYQEDGATLNFPIPWRFLAPTDIQATRTDPLGITTSLIYAADYTVTGGGTAASGTLTLASSVAGSELSIWRATPRVQPIDYQTNDRFPAETHELGLDRDMLIEQEQDGALGRAVTVPAPETGFVLPPADERADGVLGFDENGDLVILQPGAIPAEVVAQRREIIASAGQTTFQTLSPYLPGYLGVYVNGVRLSEQEFTATDGLNAVLDEPCLAGDVVLLEGFLGSPVGTDAASMSFIQAGAGAVQRSAQDKMRERVSVKDFGAVCNGVADDTVAVQNWLASAAANNAVASAPAGVIRLTAPVEIPPGVTVEGPAGLYSLGPNTAALTFLFDHLGKGFTVTGASGGRAFRHLGTARKQSAPAASWAPIACDWDFWVSGATDVSFDDVLLLNATKGIVCTNGGGRFTFNRVWGQPMQVGIQIDTALDVVRFFQCHFWPFWSNNVNVLTYTVLNGTAFYSKRNDNPDAHGLFALGYRYGLRIGNWTGGSPGTTQRMRVFGAGFDACGSGFTLDSDANGATVSLYGFYAHGLDPATLRFLDRKAGPEFAAIAAVGHLVDIQGTNSDIRIYGRSDLTNARQSAINVVGSGAALTVHDASIAVYNTNNGGFAAVNTAAAIYAVTFEGQVAISGGVSSAPAYGGTGKVFGVLRDYAVAVTCGSGSFGAQPSVGYARSLFSADGWGEVWGDIYIGTIGSATDIRISLPISANGEMYSGHAGDQTSNSSGQIRNFPSLPTAVLTKADGTLWLNSGVRLLYHLKYRTV